MHKSSRVVSTRVCPTTTTVCPTTFTTTRPVVAGVTDTVVTGAVPTTATVPTVTTIPTTAVVDAGLAGITPTGVDLASLLGQFGKGAGALQQAPGLGADLTSLLGQFGKGAGALQAPGITGGVSPLAGFVNPLAQAAGTFGAPSQIFNNPLTQLGGISPFSALAASNPSAALAALSPSLNLFNPAVNPQAALLQFNPGAAPTLAITGGAVPPLGFGKLGKGAGKGLGKAGKGLGKAGKGLGKGLGKGFGKGVPFGKGFGVI